jgi:DNA topoisomerase I
MVVRASGQIVVHMPRLRRSDCSVAGITRRRRGRGFEYVDAGGERIDDPDTLERIRDLAIPPAWRDVWICLDPLGHLQATGIDAAGRKQYAYHPRWRERRDQLKFDAMLEFGRRLPAMRAVVAEHLRRDGMDRERVLACATRLLDRGFFRIGSEGYAESNGTFGLATMRRDHVQVSANGSLIFDYPAKGGMRRVQGVVDEEARAVIATLKRRRGRSPELLAYRDGRRWHDVRSDEINDYLREITGGPCSAKDFRTWNATVLAAVALAAAAPAAKRSKTARTRAMARACREVSRYLGNTPAVCRASYIDPRVFDRFRSGWTIAGVLPDVGGLLDAEAREVVEAAVLDLLEDRRDADAVVRELPLAS